MRKFWLLVVLFVLWPWTARATTYYVDCANGSDSNTTFTSGYQTAATTGPLKTPQFLSASSTNVLAGDTVAFRAGTVCRPVAGNSTWVFKPHNGTGSFGGTASNPVIVTSYGEGPPPVLDGADCVGSQTGNCATSPIAASSWTQCTSGCPASSTVIYKLTWAIRPFAVFIDNDSGYPTLRNATCFSGTCLSHPNGTTNVEPAFKLPFWATGAYTSGDAIQNAGGWYTAGSTTTETGTAGPTCTSGSCTGTGGTITWTYRGTSYATVLAMVPNTWYWDGASLYIYTGAGDSPLNHVIEVSDIGPGGLGGTVAINPVGTEMNGITFENITIRHGKFNIRIPAPAGYSGLTLRNVNLLQAGTLPVDDGEDLANFILSGDPATPATNIGIYNSRILYGSKANITWQCTTGTVIQGNEIGFNNHGGVNNRDQVACPSTNTGDKIVGNLIHGGVVSQGPIASGASGIYIENPDATTLVDRNLIYGFDDTGICISTGANTLCPLISLYKGNGAYITNNVMEGGNAGLQLDNGPTNLKIYGNTATTDLGPNNWALQITSTALGAGNVFDNNNWYSPGGTAPNNPVFLFGTGSMSFATWQATAGSPDAHGQTTDVIRNSDPQRYWVLKQAETLRNGDTLVGKGTGVNGCIGTHGSTTLSAGSGTISIPCVTANSILGCNYTTASANGIKATPSSGSVAVCDVTPGSSTCLTSGTEGVVCTVVGM